MNSITELLKQDFAPGCYILVDDKHPLKLYIGADDAGNYALEYRGVYKPSAIKPSKISRSLWLSSRKPCFRVEIS